MLFQCNTFKVSTEVQDGRCFITYSGIVPKDISLKIRKLNLQKLTSNIAEAILKNELKKHILYTR